MNGFGWEVLDWHIPNNFSGSGSKILLCQHYGKDVLILHDEYITLVFENFLFGETSIGSVKSAKKIINVIHVLERIFMLDELGDLFELVQQSGSWAWKWVQSLDKGLAVLGLSNGLAFVRQVDKMSFIECYKLNMDEFKLEYSKKLNYSQKATEPYGLISLNNDEAKLFIKKFFKRSDVNEVIFIDDPVGFTYVMPVVNGKPFSINFDKNSLVTVLSSADQNSILLIYSNGKIISLECRDTVTSNILFLCGQVCTATWYDDEKTTLIWSDGIDLHLSKINNSDAVDLQIDQNIKGVSYLINHRDNILAVTRDNIFYNIKKNNTVLSNPIVSKKSGEILKEIYDIGLLIEKYNDDIKYREDVMYALESSKSENIEKNFSLTIRGKELNIKNKSERLFKKNLWVIRLEVCDKNKKIVEVKKLENDLGKDMSINVKTDLLCYNFIKCSFVCDCGRNFKLIEINLPKLETFKSRNLNEFDQKLSEISKKRNQVQI